MRGWEGSWGGEYTVYLNLYLLNAVIVKHVQTVGKRNARPPR